MFVKISARTLMLGAVLFGISLTPVFAETATANGETIENGTGPQDESTGDDGTDGSAGENGGNGGNGGNVTSVAPGSSSSNNDGVSAVSGGGIGGTGGVAVEGESMCFGECGGEGALPGGDGGNGGNGGTVDLTLTGTSYGNVTAGSYGGAAGQAADDLTASQAKGGDAGDVTIEIATTGIVDGNVIAQSRGGKSNMTDGSTGGQGGDVTVTISGTVYGHVSAERTSDEQVATGTIKVVIDGGLVTGTISASTANASSLSFIFDVADRQEFQAATAALTGPAAGGQVTINSHTYTWEGFGTLVDLLRYVGPEDKVVVSVKETTNETTTVGEPASPPRQAKAPVKVEDEPAKPRIVAGVQVIEGKPEMAKCSGGSEIRTVRLDNGSVVVIHHNRGADTLIGQLEGGEFHRASDAPDWVVRVGDEGKTVDVSDASGSALTSCSFG